MPILGIIASSVAFIKKFILFATSLGTIRRSEDEGVTFTTDFESSFSWVTQNPNYSTSIIEQVAYGNGMWAIGGRSSNRVNYSTDAITWNQANFVIASDAMGIAYGNNLWVAVAGSGRVSTSTNAITWTSNRVSNFGATMITSVAYGNSLWVISGYAGNVRTSTDGITWITSGSSGFGRVDTVAYGNGSWVLGGVFGGMSVSTDAVTWTAVTGNFGNTVWSVAYGNNLWVGGGQGTIRTSTDTITWITRTSNIGFTRINSVAYGNNFWVAGTSSGQQRISTDAITWTTQTSNFGNTSITSIAYGNNLWVAGGYSGQLRTSIPPSSINSISYTTIDANSSFNSSLFGGTVSSGSIYLAGGNQNTLLASTNSTTWITADPTFGASNINIVDYSGDNDTTGRNANKAFIASSTGNLTKVSTDLLTWTTITIDQGVNPSFGTSIANNITTDTATTERYRAIIGQNGLRLLSDRNTQTINNFTNLYNSAGVAFDPILTSINAISSSKFGAVGTDNLYYETTDFSTFTNTTLNWTTQTSNFGTTSVFSVAYGNSLWVAGGGTGQIRTSPDATTWTTQTSNFGTSNITSVAYGNNLWVAGGYAGQIRSSTDTITWTTRTSNFGASSIHSVAYNNL
jgi:hypothetical protein